MKKSIIGLLVGLIVCGCQVRDTDERVFSHPEYTQAFVGKKVFLGDLELAPHEREEVLRGFRNSSPSVKKISKVDITGTLPRNLKVELEWESQPAVSNQYQISELGILYVEKENVSTNYIGGQSDHTVRLLPLVGIARGGSTKSATISGHHTSFEVGRIYDLWICVFVRYGSTYLIEGPIVTLARVQIDLRSIK